MAISDDEPPFAPRRAPSSRRGGSDRQRQVMARRAVAAAVGVLVLILIVLGVRGCLNARKTRSLENFVGDLKSLVVQTNQLSSGFFQHLTNPPSSKFNFDTELRSDAGTAATLLTHAKEISTPGELSTGHTDLVLAYQLRNNALSGIADELTGANGGKANANHVVAHMKQLVASDVIYARAQYELNKELADAGVNERAPSSVFIPDYQKWLDPSKVSSVLSGVGVGSASSGSVSGVHGTGISSASINGVTLTAGVAATVTSASPNPFSISVANQGNSTETNIPVSVKVSGGISKTVTISSIPAGGTATKTVNLGSPQTGTPLTINVNVKPVVGERITSNNKATYNVTFQ